MPIMKSICRPANSISNMVTAFKALIIAFCALALAGCASGSKNVHPKAAAPESAKTGAVVESGQPRAALSENERHEVVMAANEMAMRGGDPPEAIRRLKPVQVYFEHGNVIIALDRSIREEDGRRVCYEERGYCVQPSVSCAGLMASDGHWRVKAAGGMFDGLYEYVWKK